MMLMAAYQLYAAAQQSSAEATRKARASNLAYDAMRERASSVNSTCAATAATIVSPPGTDPVVTVQVTCPYSSVGNTGVSLVKATAKYNDSPETVTHAVAKTKK